MTLNFEVDHTRKTEPRYVHLLKRCGSKIKQRVAELIHMGSRLALPLGDRPLKAI